MRHFRRSVAGTHWHCPECGAYVPRRLTLCACGFPKAERPGGRVEADPATAPRVHAAVVAAALVAVLVAWAVGC